MAIEGMEYKTSFRISSGDEDFKFRRMPVALRIMTAAPKSNMSTTHLHEMSEEEIDRLGETIKEYQRLRDVTSTPPERIVVVDSGITKDGEEPRTAWHGS